MKKILTPNSVISSSSFKILVAGQLVFLAVLWLCSPFVFLPKPGEVWTAFLEMCQSSNLIGELATSIYVSVESIAISAVISLLFAYLSIIPFFHPIIAAFGKMRFVSLVGLVFFFTLMTANGHQLRVSLLVFSISVFFVISMMDVISNIPKEQYDLARTLHMGPWRGSVEVVMLGQADKALDNLRANAAMAWLGLAFIENLDRSGGGLGTLLITEDRHFHLAPVVAIQIVFFLTGMMQDFLLGLLKRFICPYAFLKTEKR